MTTSFDFEAQSLDDTAKLGKALAQCLPEGITVALCGTLGAGKTNLVQSLAVAAGIDRHEVTSPTFVLCQQYKGSRQIYHLDAYRIHDEDEFFELGVEEYFDSTAITIIEWADRVVGCLPANHIRIDIEITGDCQRRFRISVEDHDPPEMSWFADLKQMLAS